VQHDAKTILISSDGGGSELHMGNKGGTSEDGAGEGTRASSTNTVSMNTGEDFNFQNAVIVYVLLQTLSCSHFLYETLFRSNSVR